MKEKIYTYGDLLCDMKKTGKKTEIRSLGKSVNGKDVFLLKKGHGKKNLLVICGHHSLETIMSKFIVDYISKKEESFFGSTALYAIPLLNPDGADFVSGKISISGFENMRTIWQANYNGTDLNHNYDAGFYKAKKIVEKEGIFFPNSTKYGGEKPFSEPETKIVKKLCDTIDFDLSIAFHTQGKEIYTGYCGFFPKNTDKYLDAFTSVTGYKYNIPNASASHAGFKDWFIKACKKPSFTVEAGIGKNPLPFSQYNEIFDSCSKILDCAINILKNT